MTIQDVNFARLSLRNHFKNFIFIYLFNITDKGPEGHLHVTQPCTNSFDLKLSVVGLVKLMTVLVSQWITQKEPERYSNKLFKKTTDTNYREYLQLTQKN